MTHFLEYNKEASEVVFYREVTNFEFVEKLGGVYIGNNPTERDKMLFRLGRKIFEEHPYLRVYSGKGKREPVLTNDEIEELLVAIEKSDTEPDFVDELLTPIK
jgi:hypothetical protein